MNLKMGPEDSDRGRGGDVLRQTVPNSGDRQSSGTDGAHSSMATNR